MEKFDLKKDRSTAETEQVTTQDKNLLSQDDIMELLDNCYDKSIQGIPHVSQSVE